MQLPVKITLNDNNQRIQKDLTFLLSDTPLTILLEVLKQANRMTPTDKWSVTPNRERLVLGDQIWQVRHRGKVLDLLQSLLLVPEAQQAGSTGLALEIGRAAGENADLHEELEQLRQEKQQWDRLAQEYEKQLADQAARIKQLEQQRPAVGGGALSARREIDQLKQELQAKQQEWDIERQNYEERLAQAGAASSRGAAPADAGASGDFATAQQQWETDRRDYEGMIAELQDKVAQLEQAGPGQPAAAVDAPLSSQEASEIELRLEQQHQDVEAERQKLEEDREALRQERDELQMMEQEFRNMEVKNARERAEINRQKADFQRLQRQFDFLLSQATKRPEIEKALGPVIQLREQIRKSTGQ